MDKPIWRWRGQEMGKKKKIIYCKKKGKFNNNFRCSKEFHKIIMDIKLKYMLHGKKVPSTPLITKWIAERIKKEDLLSNEFIKF